jgi:hypothetical protein
VKAVIKRLANKFRTKAGRRVALALAVAGLGLVGVTADPQLLDDSITVAVAIISVL